MRTYLLSIISMRAYAAYSILFILILQANMAWAIPPSFTMQPSNKSVCDGAKYTTLNVSATNATSYKWQVDNGGGFVNITDGALYSYSSTPYLSVNTASSSMNGYQYRCVATGPDNPAAISNPATLTVNSYITISNQPPTNVVICGGQGTSLTATATGTITGYQWQRYNGSSFIDIGGGTYYTGTNTATLTISNAVPSISSAFRCILTGPCSQAITTATYLTVNGVPTIISQPKDETVCDKTITYLNVTATGTNISYTWQYSTNGGLQWLNVPDNATYDYPTTNQLIIRANTGISGTEFRCLVSGTCSPTAVSTPITLTVNPKVVSSVNIDLNFNNVCKNIPVTFTATPTNGGNTPMYRWKVNNVYVTGASTNNRYITGLLEDNDFVSCELISDANCPVTRNVTSNIIRMQITDYEEPKITVISPNQSNIICSDVPVTFTSSVASAGPNPSYQWQVNGRDVGLNSSTYVTDSLSDNDVVRCILTSNFMCPSNTFATSNNIAMTVNQTTPATVSISQSNDTTVCIQSEVKLIAYYTNSGLNPTFQWYKNGYPIIGETGFTFTTTLLATNDVIKCNYVSSAQCVFPVESNNLKFTVNQKAEPEVKLSVHPAGENKFTFVAIPERGGTDPYFEWYVNGIRIGAGSNPLFTYGNVKSTDNVYVVMTSNDPCVKFNKATSRKITTAVGNEQFAFTDLSLYPNPNTGKFVIAGQYPSTGVENVNISIINTVGQVVYTEDLSINSGKLNHDINMNQVAAGAYMMRIYINGHQEIRRFSVTQ